jgi:hypothetical protein
MKEEEAEGMPCLEAGPESWKAGGGDGLGGTTLAMLASRFAFPAGPLRGASSALPSALVVSADLCGAKARLIPADQAALSRGKNGRRRSIALQGFSMGAPAPHS